MTPRELGGFTRKSPRPDFFISIVVNKFGSVWMEVSIAFVRDFIDLAKEDGFDIVRAEYDEEENHVYIGGDDEIPAEADAVEPPDVDTSEEEEEDPNVEEEEDPNAEEEEVEEEEEEPVVSKEKKK